MGFKICANAWFGMVNPHDFRYHHNNERRVCLKCGLIERLVFNYDGNYGDCSWERFGLVDKPFLLAKKWDEEREAIEAKRKKENESMCGKRNLGVV